jgi:hypothetical protein
VKIGKSSHWSKVSPDSDYHAFDRYCHVSNALRGLGLSDKSKYFGGGKWDILNITHQTDPTFNQQLPYQGEGRIVVSFDQIQKNPYPASETALDILLPHPMYG